MEGLRTRVNCYVILTPWTYSLGMKECDGALLVFTACRGIGVRIGIGTRNRDRDRDKGV